MRNLRAAIRLSDIYSVRNINPTIIAEPDIDLAVCTAVG